MKTFHCGLNKKIHFSQNAMLIAIYFLQEVVCGLYQEDNPAMHLYPSITRIYYLNIIKH